MRQPRCWLAAGSLSAAVTVAPAGHAGAGGTLANDAQGNSYVVWFDYVTNRVHLRRLLAGGTLEPEMILSPAGKVVDYLSPALAVGTEGTAFVAWSNKSDFTIELTVVPPGGPQGAVEVVRQFAADTALEPQVITDSRNTAYLVWSNQIAPGKYAIEFRARAASGTMSAIDSVTAPGAESGEKVFGVGSDGSAAVAWRDDGALLIRGRHRSADGVWGSVVDLSMPGMAVQQPTISVGRGGDALVAWRNNALARIEARAFRADDSLDPLEVSSGADTNVFGPQAGSDGLGNAVLVWQDAGNRQIDGEAFDGAGPELRALSVPASLERGEPGTFSFEPFDLFFAPAESGWQFGDGSPDVPGTSATHTFARAGDVVVRAFSTDTVGNRRVEAFTVRVVDTRRPIVAGLKLSRKRFAVGRRATAEIASTEAVRAGRKVRSGTTISYRLSEDADVTFTVQRRAAGRRVGRSCRRPSRRNANRRKCRRYVTVAAFVRTQTVGLRRVAFSGKVGRRRLSPGKFRLGVEARDPSGNRSRRQFASFTIIVRGSR